MLGLIDRWLVQTSGSQNYRASDYAFLALILAIGIFLRFWGLGDFSLHGDERHMATPAMAILETGEPILPSGMYYSRALAQIYLMVGSVWIFGESEWAFRLPSALVGSLTGLAAFFMGRRFLSPQFNITFVATITFLPALVEDSQHARMYIFLVTCLIWFAACLFRWERDQRISSLILALLVWSLAMHFQVIAIFAAPLFLFPGLSRQSWKQLIQGAAAFATGALLFEFYRRWMSSKFRGDMERLPPLEEAAAPAPLEVVVSGNEWLMLAGVAVILVLASVFAWKVAKSVSWVSALPILLVGTGLLGMSVLHYHVGGLFLVFGTVLWLRDRQLPVSWLLSALGLALVLAAAHMLYLHGTGLYPGRRLIGAVIGTPSIWPTLRFLQYSPVAGVIYGFVLLLALARFAGGKRLPIHFLFFAMAVWIPLLIIGYHLWYLPPRYTQGQLAFFLLCVFAGLAYLGSQLGGVPEGARIRRPMAVALVIVCVLMINPFALARTVNPDFSSYPDHKGAAEYIEAVDPGREAVLIAEDAAHQTYYLGKVDYWLREFGDVRTFAFVRDGRVLDVYTGAEVIGTGAELQAVLDANADRAVYVIGSGENFSNGVRSFRGEGIAEVLASPGLEVVYEGRDGNTKVWRMRSP